MWTERQKHLIAPAMKMTGFIYQTKLDKYEITKDYYVSFVASPMRGTFDAKEKQIKDDIKNLLTES